MTIPKHTKGSQVSYTIPFLFAGSHQHLADKGSDWEKSLECSSQHSVPSLRGHLAYDGALPRLLQLSQSNEPKCPRATRAAGVDVPERAQGELQPITSQPSFLTPSSPSAPAWGTRGASSIPCGGVTELHPLGLPRHFVLHKQLPITRICSSSLPTYPIHFFPQNVRLRSSSRPWTRV